MKSVEELVRDTVSWSEKRRRAAWQELARRKEPQAVEKVIALAEERSGEVPTPTDRAVRAMRVLGELGDAQAIPAASDGATGWRPDMRRASLETLGKLGDPRGVGPALRSFSEYRGTRDAAGGALARLGHAFLVPLLDAIAGRFGLGLGYWAEKARREANAPGTHTAEVDALAFLTEDRAVPTLVRSLSGAGPEWRDRVIQGWLARGAEVVERLFRLAESEDLCASLWAAEALGSIGGDAVSRRLAERWAAGKADLWVAVSLGFAGDARALPALSSALSHVDQEARLAAVDALAGLGGGAGPALSILHARLTNEKDRDVRGRYQQAIRPIENSLATMPAELEAAHAPEGRGDELEAANGAGRGM